ncbi:type II CAAX endopeptidase family protein [Geodermatophilus sp. DSM 45219]|uniref:type II CAAX endopeptidase family protein n=1 Tax=Geodermatophilus sp. DSM 45219 TaxID=1881103 RepID=UPI000889E357|nr:type II CAAX endopeptidase family protein [Geodermatophilus sp. DSM 45219]SDN48452.1 CAAX protease self-immunity [Geodermatophilus sp. DSM 45219]
MSALHHGRRTPVPTVPRTRDTTEDGWRGWVARRPVTAFLLLALPLGWAVLGVPALAYHGLLPGGQLPVEVFALALTVLVMLPAAVWVVSVAEGRAGVRRLFARTFRWRFGPGWWAAVLLALPVGTVVLGLLSGRSLQTADLPSVLLSGTLAALLPLFLVNLWEETVWAGFVQVHLERRHGLVAAAALTGVAFAAIHVPLSFAEEFTASSVLLELGFVLAVALLFRLLAGIVLRGTAGSVLAVAVLHAVWNASNSEDSIVDDLLSGGQPVLFAVLAVALLTAVTAPLVRGRGTAEQQETGTSSVTAR